MGLGGIEPPTSALSVLGEGLVRQLVCLLNCHFVPRGATRRRVVPFRLGTLWARDGSQTATRHRPRGHRAIPICGPPFATRIELCSAFPALLFELSQWPKGDNKPSGIRPHGAVLRFCRTVELGREGEWAGGDDNAGDKREAEGEGEPERDPRPEELLGESQEGCSEMGCRQYYE